MKKYMEVLGSVLLFILILSFCYGMWRVERYLNWKFGYGPRVERRVEKLEDRIEKLENNIEK